MINGKHYRIYGILLNWMFYTSTQFSMGEAYQCLPDSWEHFSTASLLICHISQAPHETDRVCGRAGRSEADSVLKNVEVLTRDWSYPSPTSFLSKWTNQDLSITSCASTGRFMKKSLWYTTAGGNTRRTFLDLGCPKRLRLIHVRLYTVTLVLVGVERTISIPISQAAEHLYFTCAVHLSVTLSGTCSNCTKSSWWDLSPACNSHQTFRGIQMHLIISIFVQLVVLLS